MKGVSAGVEDIISQRGLAQKQNFQEDGNIFRRILFNVFRSYGDTPMEKKPPQYSRKGLRTRDINEYLTSAQKKMQKYRHNDAVDKEDTFDGSWSGYKQYAELKSLRGGARANA
jgi:hypothetical protein